MRLLFVGSLESIHTRRWVGYFADRGHEVHAYSPLPYIFPNPPSYDIDGVVVHTFRRARTGLPFLDTVLTAATLAFRVVALRRLIGRLRPHVVHVHYVNDLAIATALTGFKPLVLTAWGSDVLFLHDRSRWIRFCVKKAIRQADLITCDADHMEEALVAQGAEPSKVRIVYFGTDVETFVPTERNPALGQKLGLGDGPLVVSVRNLEPVYDLPTLVRAVPQVLKAVPEAKFLIGGTGSEEPALKELAGTLEIDEAVAFLGSVDQADMAELLASADVYVSTALSDAGLSASTAEAMACETPVLVSDVADNRDWVREGETGYLFPAGDSESLSARLVDLLSGGGSGTDSTVRRSGRREIVRRNNWNREMEKMESYCREVVRDASTR